MNTLLRKGFTLIELSVVILIISILVAVALPQYQLVVTKSRFATLKSAAHSLLNAAEVYYLTHGTYPRDLANLDVDFKNNSSVSCRAVAYNNNQGIYILCTRSDIRMAYQIYPDRLHQFNVCLWYNKDNKIAQKICAQETGSSKLRTDSAGSPYYYYQ